VGIIDLVVQGRNHYESQIIRNYFIYSLPHLVGLHANESQQVGDVDHDWRNADRSQYQSL